ncbi:hypothetical protein GCM10027280_61520 [Micromonospora polyrhachis]|uniref:DUF2726 domain-containing protein n=1 Tax=Micromonospora polyrhachis TaxID=1282883 RepID=A0A7W7SWY1_9ACTN|nr:hypothetical protein [Micromonospora polyrhachis]MBB4962451.1 hypothetical protein [Micromonospora polyrhachis]
MQSARTLNEIVQRRPPGVTGHQWSCATRTRFDFVVFAADRHSPLFGVEFDDPGEHTLDTRRSQRMKHAVWAAVDLPVLVVESPTLRPAVHGRGIVDYVVDARAYAAAAPEHDDESQVEGFCAPPTYRDIIGRLPDGRSGFVNDLGAVARAAAIEAYVDRQLADPIIRGLHVEWRDGCAEGWGWIEVRDGEYIFERTRVAPYRFSCGVDPGRLAEDLAALAIGEQLKVLVSTEPPLRTRRQLEHELVELLRRHDEMAGDYLFDHISFE